MNLKVNVRNLSTEITQLLSKENINSIAKETGFIQRNGKIDGFIFLDIILFTYFNQKELSLNDLSIQIKKRFGIKISKQSIDERFTNIAVTLFKRILEKALKIVLNKDHKIDFLTYDKVPIKDSTSFQLPENMVDKYKGCGGSGSKSTLRIQFEYDLKSSEILDLSLFAYVNQDATNAKETIDRVNSNELIIRDLAYISIPIMRKIEEKEAFYLNRMQTSVTVFEKINNKFVEIDFPKLHKKMKILHLSILDKEVYIGKKEKFKTRMIVEPLSTQQYNERIRKAEKTAKRKGRAVSDSYKAKAALNIFITNTDVVAKNIRILYTLRWQIELMFKIWKSIGEIDKVKKMKIERFESFLLAKLIWIVLNWQIMRLSVIYFFKEKQLEISPYKLFKTLKSSILDFRKALSESVSSLILFIHENIELCPSNHLSEKKKKTITWSYDIYRLFKII